MTRASALSIPLLSIPLLLPLIPLLLLARTAAGAEPSALDRADALFAEGKKLVNDGDLPGALAKYEEAYALKPSADIACNLGSVEFSLKAYARGASHLDECLRIFPATGTPQQKAAATDLLAKAKAEVAEVRVTANKEGAKLLVDGKAEGLLPRAAPLYLMPGEHTVSASLEGFTAMPTTVAAVKGAPSTIELKLEPAVAPPPPSSRSLVPAAIGFVLGGGALAAAIGTAVASAGVDFSDCPTRTACEDLKTEKNALGNASASLFIVSGVALGAATGLLVWGLGGRGPKKNEKNEKNEAWTITPVVGPDAGGVWLGGSF